MLYMAQLSLKQNATQKINKNVCMDCDLLPEKRQKIKIVLMDLPRSVISVASLFPTKDISSLSDDWYQYGKDSSLT